MNYRALCLLIHSTLAEQVPQITGTPSENKREVTCKQAHIIELHDIPRLLDHDDPKVVLEQLVVQLLSYVKHNKASCEDSKSSEVVVTRLKEKLQVQRKVGSSQHVNFLRLQLLKLQATVDQNEQALAEQAHELAALKKEHRGLQHKIKVSRPL
jgi:hypothetical protein